MSNFGLFVFFFVTCVLVVGFFFTISNFAGTTFSHGRRQPCGKVWRPPYLTFIQKTSILCVYTWNTIHGCAGVWWLVVLIKWWSWAYGKSSQKEANLSRTSLWPIGNPVSDCKSYWSRCVWCWLSLSTILQRINIKKMAPPTNHLVRYFKCSALLLNFCYIW